MTYVLAIHGGAGTVNRDVPADVLATYHAGLQQALQAGEAVLAAGGSAQDAVVAAVRALEDCPLFNAGLGAVFAADGIHELDASVMDGAQRAAGAVTCVSRVKNPVLLAQQVLRDGRCVLLTAVGAERFAQEQGVEMVEPEYFSTDARCEQLQVAQIAQREAVLDHDAQAATPLQESTKMGTVGAVALDSAGNLAAATSTGGMTNKRAGRVGDTPVIGAGCYADNRSVAVSCTGTGEHFMRGVIAHEVDCRVRLAGQTLAQAAQAAIDETLTQLGGRGGLIALDAHGNLALPFNTSGMYRGWVKQGQAPQTAIFAE